MREAPVGWQCTRCVHNDAKTAPVSRWRPRQVGTLGASRLTPVVIVLIALNVVIFLIEETNLNSIAFRYALIPILTPGERYRLITAAFLHASFTHIFLNMITLAIIGPAVETAIGKSRFVAVYLLAAFGGEVCSYLLGPLNVESLGASGAIFGLMGAYFVLARRRGWDLSIVVPLIVINLIFSFLDPAIDWRAHVGGLAIGALVAVVFLWTEGRAPKVRRAAEPLACAAILVALGALSFLPPGHVNI
jgi:membrane associated rhomboid family serine protease